MRHELHIGYPPGKDTPTTVDMHRFAWRQGCASLGAVVFFLFGVWYLLRPRKEGVAETPESIYGSADESDVAQAA